MSIAWWHRFSAPTGASWPRARWGPGCVVVPQVLGQHLAQVVLIDDQQPVEELAA